jgi:hypothetical protein
MPNKKSLPAYIIIALGFFLRLAYVQLINPISSSIFSDMNNYVSIADSINAGIWRASHFFQPIGFPYLILNLKNLTTDWMSWLEWIHILTSTCSLWFLWQTAKESFGEKIGLISLGLASVHLPWIAFAGLALAENIYIFLLTVLAWLTLKLVREEKPKQAIFWAFFFFLAFLIKGTLVFYGPLFIFTLFYFFRQRAIRNILLISVIMLVGLIGHGLFTKAKIGHFQISASAGGLNLVEGKCPLKNNADSAGYSWLSPLYHQLGLNQLKRWDHPFTDSAFFTQEGLKCIKENPFVLIQSFEGIPYLFFGNTLWPVNQSKIAKEMRLYELYYSCFCVIGLICYFRFLKSSDAKREEVLVWVLPLVSIMLCVYIFKSEIRFRIPFDVWFIPVAVKGWSQLFKAKVV